MEYAVNFSRRAELDLDLLFVAIDAENSEAAFKWYLGLKEAISTLETHPKRCPVTPESHHFRHLLHGRKPNVYRVIYEVSEDRMEVTIVHIRHGAQQPFTSADLN
jgi:toxin ParE1/3/4